MRLYLSSEGVGSQPEELIELVGDNCPALIIANALDHKGEHYKEGYIAAEQKKLVELGIESEVLDLRNHFGHTKTDELRERIGQAGLLWALGGNTFNLRRAMHASGFDEVARPLIEDGAIAYGGFGAGTVAATCRIDYIAAMDNPDTIPEGYPNEQITAGLDLAPLPIIPHYGSERFHQDVLACIEVLKTTRQLFYCLKDGMVLVINNGKYQVVGGSHDNTGD